MRRSNSWPISIHGSASSSTVNRTPSPEMPPRHLSPLSRKRANMKTEAKVFFFQADDGIRVADVTGVQTCALPIFGGPAGEVERPGAGAHRHQPGSRPA